MNKWSISELMDLASPHSCVWSAVLATVLCKLWLVTNIPLVNLIFSEYQPQVTSDTKDIVINRIGDAYMQNVSTTSEQKELLSHRA